MAKILLLLTAVGIGLVAYVVQKNVNRNSQLPTIEQGYFGPGDPHPDKVDLLKIRIDVKNVTLDSLQKRLQQARLFDSLEDSNFEYGVNSKYLKSLLAYWRDQFDWRQQEKIINRYDHYKTEIDGLFVHFIHVKPDANVYGKRRIRPLMIVHGWPGSIFEFYKIIPMLVDPLGNGGSETDPVFEVIAPSIPGYGWSEAPKKKGFDTIAAAVIFAKLMERLGHTKYFLQGGDWGSIITTRIAQLYPERVSGLHVNMASVDLTSDPFLFIQFILGAFMPSLVLNPADHYKMYPIKEKFLTILQESGYMHIQATKPDTVGIALNDSPIGLAGYIIEKFSTWTHPAYKSLEDGGLNRHFTMDELLTNVMVYWVTQSIASSQRLYKEHFKNPYATEFDRAPVVVPVGIAQFPNELLTFPRHFLAYRYKNILTYADMPRGGHFAAFEEPQLLADEIRRFVLAVQERETVEENNTSGSEESV